MKDKSSVIFGNTIDEKTLRSAEKSKRKYLQKYGDDSGAGYCFAAQPIDTLDFLGVDNLVFSETNQPLDKNAVIIGNIRMGFGHYRIAIAMASCAKALGYKPYWFDLAGFDATGSKMIRQQNDLYSLASRISQKSKIFNKLIWEPMNSEGFKKIEYNAKDQKNSELLVPIYGKFPKDIPFIATHVWGSQGAIHAGLTNVVNAIPDNWPMGLHLSEGAIHAVQTPFAYLGYKMLNDFSKKPLQGIPDDQIKMVGRYVDHELLVNLEENNAARINRAKTGKPLRFLMTIGGAGAGFKQFMEMVEHLIPYIKDNKAALFVNFGDHKKVYEQFLQNPLSKEIHTYLNQYSDLKALVNDLQKKDAQGIYAICNDNIFEAVYSTNLLMPQCDVLITKPSELSFYPIPKIFMRHIGGHEKYGAINSSELGDGTFECDTKEKVNRMMDIMIHDNELYCSFCRRIDELKKEGYYNGGYECVKLAVGNRKQ